MTRLLSSSVRPLLVVSLFLLAVPALAQNQDRTFSPQLWHPAPGPDHFISVEPAQPFGHKGWGVGLYLNYARNQFSILNFDTTQMKATSSRADILAHGIGADVWAGIGLWKRFQLALAIPMMIYQTGSDFIDADPAPAGTRVRAASGFAFGDPRLHLKGLLYGKDYGFKLALSHWLGFPFGNDSEFGGEKHFTGFSGEARALAGWDAERWRIGAFIGFLWRANTSHFFSTDVGQQLTYGGAIAFDVVAKRFTLVAEIFGRNQLGTEINNSPLELALAGKVTIIPGLTANLGIGNGLVAGLGAPQPRVFLGFVYAPDTKDEDKDGVPDSVDMCLGKPEDKDGFKDKDGCPDPDNDGDTLLDKDDKCPDAAEDFDEFQDEDGCPDLDDDNDGVPDISDPCPRDPEDGKGPKPKDGCPLSKTDQDGDGINDANDKCPADPEDKDGFQDEDGCPDPDNDGDGIPDGFDQCVDKPEDMDGFEDEDGCPDLDNDKDGIPDKDDKCPLKPENINGFEDEDGCPDKGPPPKVKIERGMIVILDKIFFDTGKATIKPQSFNLLDQVALTIKAHPEFKIRVEGHTDSQGKQDANIKLSQERAESVRTYLIKKNIEPDRLQSVGYGPATPIADNKTKAGREANRRVEFHIVEEPVKKKAPEPEAAPTEATPELK
jgi:outer membrane protein OmpA-like peptidoglycan-associated protein